MVLDIGRRVDSGFSRLIQWVVPSTTVLGATTTGSQTSVTDTRDAHETTPDPAEATPSMQEKAVAAARPLLAVQPEAIGGTSEPLREAARRSLVPRWLAALRTQMFTGLAATGLMVFAGLAMLVTNGLTAGLDLAVTQTIQGVSLPIFGTLMLGTSLVGFPPQAYMIVVGVAALFWFSGYRTESGFAVVAAASVILTETFKRLIGRPRPDADLVSVIAGAGGHSFPSGHVLFYVTFFGFLAYLAYAQLKPGRVRTVALWLTGILILLVGPSRIWMGHHWVSDVLASYALGFAYLVVLVQTYSRRRLARAARHTPASAASD